MNSPDPRSAYSDMRIQTLIIVFLLFSGCQNGPKTVVSYDPPENASYLHEEVNIVLENGDLLAGSLTIPGRESRDSPIAILITGSSAHDRDNSKPGKPLDAYRPFRQIAHTLSSNGIAVLRMDDRGVGRSRGGDINKMNTLERAADIEQCITWIKSRPEIDPARICLVGLSEGASIAHIIASQDNSISGIVLLSGTGSKGKDIIAYQIQNGLLPEEDLQKILRRDPNMRFLNEFDPLESISQLTLAVLIIHGQTDRRVPCTDAYLLEEALVKAGNEKVSVYILPGYNHALLKEDPGGKDSSYGKISSNQIPDEVLNLILSWIQQEI